MTRGTKGTCSITEHISISGEVESVISTTADLVQVAHLLIVLRPTMLLHLHVLGLLLLLILK